MAGHPASSFASYEDYATSQLTPQDLKYLGNAETARFLVELGFLRQGAVSRAEFEAQHKALADQKAAVGIPKLLASAGLRASPKKDSPLLQELAARELDVIEQRVAVVIFLRLLDGSKHEKSGYIDFHHRLSQEGAMEAVFQGKAQLLPDSQDLSYYSYATQLFSTNSTETFEVITDGPHALVFRDKRDRKSIDVSNACEPSCEGARLDIQDPGYLQAVLFCKAVRRH